MDNLVSTFSSPNFVNIIAEVLSLALTDRETETLVQSFQNLHRRLRSISNRNLRQLAYEAKSTKAAPPNLCQHEGKTCSLNCTRGFIKGFSGAYAVKYILELITIAISGKVFFKPRLLKSIGGRDTIYFALFIGTFISSYKGALCLFRKVLPNVSEQTRAFFAGVVSSFSLFLEKNQDRRLAVALYLFSRAMQYTVVWLMKRWRMSREDSKRSIRRVRSEEWMSTRKTHTRLEDSSEDDTFPSVISSPPVNTTTWQDKLDDWLRCSAGTLVMTAATMQILFAYIFAPWSLPRSYMAFLVTHGGLKARYGAMTVPLLAAMGDTATRLKGSSGPDIMIPDNTTSQEYISRIVSPNFSVLYEDDPTRKHTFVGCALVHPWETKCWRAHLNNWIRSFGRSLWLYVPLNAFTFLIFQGKKIWQKPRQTFIRYIKATLRSACFLASYCTVAWLLTCVCRYAFQRELVINYIINTVGSGLCSLIEAPGRRLELGMYCLPRAIESAFRCGVAWGWWRSIPKGEIIYFSLGTGALMSFYQTEPDVIQDSYRGVMTRIFGKN